MIPRTIIELVQFVSADRLRRVAAFIGRQAAIWGAITAATGLALFACDIGFALFLQRFLFAIGLISSAPSQLLGPLRDAVTEGMLFVGFGLLRVAVGWVNASTTGLCHVAFETRQRCNLVRWALHSGKASIGEVSTLFNDVALGSAAAVANCFYLASRAFLVGGIAIVLVYSSWRLTLLLAIASLIVWPLYRLLDRRLTSSAKVVQKSLAGALDRLTSGIKNSIFLQLHGLAAAEAKQTIVQITGYAHASAVYYQLASLRAAVPQLVAIVVIAGIASNGSALLATDKSHILAYLYLALRLLQSFGETSRVGANLRLNGPRLQTLYKWWRERFDPARQAIDRDFRTSVDEPFASPVGWRLQGVSFRWSETTPLIERLNLTIPAGTMTVISGESGVGKTSALLLLAGLLRPHEGEVRLIGPGGEEQPLQHNVGKLLASASYVGPEIYTAPGTVRDLLLAGARNAPSASEIDRALAAAHCDFVRSLALGLDHPMSEQGAGLSAGQKQRVALAGALLRNPRVLLLDEPTANLDSATEAEIVRTLHELKGRMTIVAVTHSGAIRKIADQVVYFVAPGRQETTPPNIGDDLNVAFS